MWALVTALLSGHGLTTKDACAPEGYTCGFLLESGHKCMEHYPTRGRRDRHKKAAGHIKSKAGGQVEGGEEVVEVVEEVVDQVERGEVEKGGEA